MDYCRMFRNVLVIGTGRIEMGEMKQSLIFS